jgi:hypothetical protein
MTITELNQRIALAHGWTYRGGTAWRDANEQWHMMLPDWAGDIATAFPLLREMAQDDKAGFILMFHVGVDPNRRAVDAVINIARNLCAWDIAAAWLEWKTGERVEVSE